MKFGSQLRDSLYVDWIKFYLEYDGLKKHLKRGEKKEGGYTEKDESDFVEKLDKELEKIYAFQTSKYEEIKGRVQNCEKAIESINSNTSMNVPERYTEIEREINDITEELNELAKYARLNYTGIIKIVKKHDRRTHYILRPMFSVRLNARPFYKETYEPIIVQLSKLYHVVHQGLGGDSSTSERPPTPNFSSLPASSWNPSTALPSQEEGVRQSYKYWVHQDNLMEVKTTILRHLPVLIYKPGSDSSVTSIYFDNELFELYQDKVDRKSGGQIIRLRWYGNKMNTNDVFVERKIREQGENEIKDRFLVKDKYVNAFLKGEYSMDKTIKKMEENPSKTEEDIQRFKDLVKDIQDNLKDKKLEPVLRTYYNRMAFQIPGDRHVRISLDTDFYMVREDNFDNGSRRGDNEWYRKDINDDQFNKFPPSECVRFPHALLEVNLRLDEGEKEPSWVKELLNSHLVEEAPQFTKYVHGVATLFTSQAPSLPYWLPNIDKNILKPPSARPSQDEDYPEQSTSSAYAANRPKRTMSGKNVINIEVVGDGGSRNRKKKGKAVDYNIEEEEVDDENEPSPGEEEDDEQQRPMGLKAFRKMFRRKKRSTPELVVLPPNISIPRKIVTPVRVEPKVFFANERTFFHWMRFSVLLGSFSLGLFNAGANDKVGNLCGFTYAMISIFVLIYSLVKYNKRLTMINNKHPGPYDDTFAPPLVCFALFIAVGMNFYLRYNPTMVEGKSKNIEEDIDFYSSNINTSSLPIIFNMQNV